MDFNLKELIDQLVKMKGIKRELIIDIVKEALYRAVQKKLGSEADIDIMYDDATGTLEAYYFRLVTDRVEDPGDIIYDEFKNRQSEIITGTVRRFEKTGIIVDIGKTEAYLPYTQQIPSDRFKTGDRIKAFILEVKKPASGQSCNILLSRVNTMFLIKLFELEVPEIAEKIVKIEGVARDPGHRSKISVRSIDHDVDPVGACVGMKGSRIQNVVHELSGEKIDIIPWDEDSVLFPTISFRSL